MKVILEKGAHLKQGTDNAIKKISKIIPNAIKNFFRETNLKKKIKQTEFVNFPSN